MNEVTIENVFESEGRMLAELRAKAMKPGLQNIGRFDEDQVRSRFLGTFNPLETRELEKKRGQTMMQSEIVEYQVDRPPVDTWHHAISPATNTTWHDRRDEAMSNNAEEGIARIQAAAAKPRGAAGLKAHHNWNIAYLNERILVSLMAIATLGVIVLWATATSRLVL